MSNPIILSCGLLFAGVLIGLPPFIGGLRELPRWIRIGQLLIGICFVTGAGIAFFLYSSGVHLSYPLHRLIFFHFVAITGMGSGIILLLLVSGEYFKALRELDATRKSRAASDATTDATKKV